MPEGIVLSDATLITLYKYQVPDDDENLFAFFHTRYRGPKIAHPWIHLASDGVMKIKRGYSWDGASFFPDTYWIKVPSLPHDAFYQLLRDGNLPAKYRKIADLTLRDHCKEHGAAWYEYYAVYRIVRMFGALFV